jgi:two-component system chemotaxis sensor kinase CheA
MSMENYRDVFLEEARENITNLNRALLDFEKNIEDLTPVNELFRAAHTLKGMSATMGYDKLAGFTHVLEEVLDTIRAGKIKAGLEIMNLLFKSVDSLEEFIDNITVNNADVSSDAAIITAEIKKQLGAGSGESGVNAENRSKPAQAQVLSAVAAGPAGTAPDIEIEPDIAAEAAKQGLRAYKIFIKLADNCAFKSVRAFMVSRNLSEKGEIIKSFPAAKEIEEGNFENSFQLGYVSALDPSEVKKLLIKISEITDVNVTEVNAPAAEEIPVAAVPGTTPVETLHRKGGTSQSVRVNVEKLDILMNLVGELVINKIRFDQIAKEKKYELLNETVEEFDRVIDELQIEITSVRMLPVSHIFDKYPRVVRDLAVQAGKQIDLEISGGDIEIDRTVLEEINEPILHLIRNSVAHGIEMPEEREKAGKSKKGVIRLGARRERNSVIIEVSDDGRGVSVSKVKKKAIEKGLITEDRSRTMSDDEIVSIIALPGFSTAENVNQVSGRGVGVDVVKTKVEAFGGIFKIENYPGEGMKSILKLPLTLAIIQALLVKVNKQTYSLPVLHTIETIEVETKDVKYIQERKVIVLREEVIPLVSLAELLNNPYTEKDVIQIVIVEVRDKKIAIEVDKVLGQQEVAIKSLGDMLKYAKGFSGVTILGDGRISLIVDIPSLL